METPPTPQNPRRKRGAQPGNRNAYKHGFYARPFSRQEINSLDDVQNGMADEIAMLRLLMRRIMEQAEEKDGGLQETLQTLQRLSLVANRLAKLIKIHHELTGKQGAVNSHVEDVKREFSKMLDEKGWPKTGN